MSCSWPQDIGAHVGDGQAFGAVVAGDQADELADRSGAGDQDPFAGDIARLADAVHGDRQGFEQGRFLVG